MSSAASKRPAVPPAIAEVGVIAIGRRLPPSAMAEVADALVAGGIRALEITIEGDGGVEALASLVATHGDRLTIGAGTVLDVQGAEAALAAGATFLVSPHTDAALVSWAAERGIPVMPGAFTPTEVLTGWRAGASAVKLFPASALGVAFLRDLRGPLPDVPIIPTGGMTADTASDWITAGAVAIGFGSWLVRTDDPELVTRRAREVVAAVAAARGRDRLR